MKKAVIFDMDGVLVDNSAVHQRAFVIFAARHGVRIGPEAIEPYFGMGNREILPAVMGRTYTDEELERLADEKEAVYREIYAGTIEAPKGLVALLRALREKGAKLAVGTSGSRENLDFVLDSLHIRSYFDGLVFGDMLQKAKPDPEVYLKAAALLGEAPADCVVVEDAFAGIRAARAAGMKTVVVTTSYPREQHHDYDYLIDDFTQITADQVLD